MNDIKHENFIHFKWEKIIYFVFSEIRNMPSNLDFQMIAKAASKYPVHYFIVKRDQYRNNKISISFIANSLIIVDSQILILIVFNVKSHLGTSVRTSHVPYHITRKERAIKRQIKIFLGTEWMLVRWHVIESKRKVRIIILLKENLACLPDN